MPTASVGIAQPLPFPVYLDEEVTPSNRTGGNTPVCQIPFGIRTRVIPYGSCWSPPSDRRRRQGASPISESFPALIQALMYLGTLMGTVAASHVLGREVHGWCHEIVEDGDRNSVARRHGRHSQSIVPCFVTRAAVRMSPINA